LGTRTSVCNQPCSGLGNNSFGSVVVSRHGGASPRPDRPVSADLPAHKDLRTTPRGRGTRRDWFNLKLQSREDCHRTVAKPSVAKQSVRRSSILDH
jgi:hypothetical protein